MEIHRRTRKVPRDSYRYGVPADVNTIQEGAVRRNKHDLRVCSFDLPSFMYPCTNTVS